MERRPRTAPQLRLLLGGGSWILTLLYFIGQAVAVARQRVAARERELGGRERNVYLRPVGHEFVNRR